MLNYSMMSLCLSTLKPEAVVAEAVKFGMTGIDWTGTWYSHGYGTYTPEYLKKISDDAGLKVVCYIAFLQRRVYHQPDGEAELQRELDRAALCGADKILIPTLPLDGVTDRRENQKRWLEVVSQAAEECRIRNLTPTIENFPGELSPCVTPDDFLLFHDAVPSLRLTFDVGNAWTGQDPVESFRRTLPWTVHMHFKDFHCRMDEAPGFWRGLDGRWYRAEAIGEGDFNYPPMLRAIRESGYQGWINVEYEANTYSQLEGVRRSVRYIQAIDNMRTDHEVCSFDMSKKEV